MSKPFHFIGPSSQNFIKYMNAPSILLYYHYTKFSLHSACTYVTVHSALCQNYLYLCLLPDTVSMGEQEAQLNDCSVQGLRQCGASIQLESNKSQLNYSEDATTE